MKKYLIYCVFAIVAFGCNGEKREAHNTADTTEANLENNDTLLTEKIIKTADMRFRVKDVQSSKEKLTGIIRNMGGNLSEFSIQSNVQQREKVKYSADSLLELTAYTTEGMLVAKVPSDKLDGFTNQVVKLSVFVDQQSLKMDDQSVAYLANKLKNINRAEAVEQLNKHASKKSNNVETALFLKDDYVDKKIENLLIDNKVKYSNITLNFYQDNAVRKQLVANDDLYDYRPGFGNRIVLNLQNGWVVFVEIILALTNLWVLILLAVAGFFIFRRYKRQGLSVKTT
ncbi:MAG: DUF4349 domain-containing protein [Bacteroidota bacterium]